LNEKIIYFCIIDTPGLYDTQGVQVDEIQKKIVALISNENIKIKKIIIFIKFS